MAAPRRIGRYLLFEAFARGGMGSVHFGRVQGPVGFSRVVAIKRHHPHVAKEPEFVAMLIDEARLAGRVRHPNVVPVIDVVSMPGELLLIMDYVEGLSLSRLWLAAHEHGERVPVGVAVAAMVGALQGLHAAHETRDEHGETLGIVHRDVSPQNILVGADGLARVTDFGIAHAKERLSFTRTTEIKGKLEYMSREQIRREKVDGRSDVYAAGVVLWETLTGERLFAGDDVATMLSRMNDGAFGVPSVYNSDVPAELDEVVLSALSARPNERPSSARELAIALQKASPMATQMELAEWVTRIGKKDLDHRAERVRTIESYVEAPSSSPVATALDDESGPTPEMGVDAGASEPARVVAEVRPTPTFTASYAGSPPASTGGELTTPISAPRHDAPAPVSVPTPPPVTHGEIPTRRTNQDTTLRSTPRAERIALMIPLLALIGGLLVVVAVALARALGHPPPRTGVASAPEPVLSPTVVPVPSPVTADPVLVEPSAAPTQTDSGVLRRPVRTSTKPNCANPFRIDKNGVKIPRPECFKK